MSNQSLKSLIYFDNAATSWPKPPGVAESMNYFIEKIGANPGRSGHQLAVDSSRIVFKAREKVNEFFHGPDPLRVVFQKNITEAINLVLKGLLKPGDHAVTSSMEHNAVMRPLRALEMCGVQVTAVPCDCEGQLEPLLVEKALRDNTKLIVINHGSNVTGTLLPIAEIGCIARKHNRLFLVDTAQTAGAFPIDMQKMNIDILTFTGHKSLLGPMGTGGLILGSEVNPSKIEPLIRGGTGSRSEEEYQPEFLPDMFESGTQNAVGLAGLTEGIQFIQKTGVETIRKHEIDLITHLREGLDAISDVINYSPINPNFQTGTLSFNILGMSPSEVGFKLDDEFGILSRVGLHCAPAAHKTVGTFPDGSVRFGIGYFNSHEEVDYVINAVSKLAKGML
jgi:cysteine desulfurase family protein